MVTMAKLTAEDFATPEAAEKAKARVMAEHFNAMHKIADADILAVFNMGRLNVDMFRGLLGDTDDPLAGHVDGH